MPDPVAGNQWWIAGAFGPGVAVTNITPAGVVTTTGTPADPAGAITFTVTDPNGVVTITTIIKNGSGVYPLAVYCPTPGQWKCVIVAAYPSTGYGEAVVYWTVALV